MYYKTLKVVVVVIVAVPVVIIIIRIKAMIMQHVLFGHTSLWKNMPYNIRCHTRTH